MAAQPTRAELIDAVLLAGRRVGQAAVLFHTRVADHFGLGPADLKTLDLIERHGQITPADLAREMGLAPASITAVLDRLERKHLLRRVPHPGDRRRLFVEFDPAAMDQMAPLYEGFVRSLHEMLSQYDDGELRFIERVYNEVADRQIAAANDIGEPHTNAPQRAVGETNRRGGAHRPPS